MAPVGLMIGLHLLAQVKFSKWRLENMCYGSMWVIFDWCYKNTTTVFHADRKRQHKGTERGIWEAPPLYYLLRQDKTQRGREE